MASHIPLALSLLQAMASQYPGLHKSQPTTMATAPPPPAAAAAAAAPPPAAPSVPVSIPHSQPAQRQNMSGINGLGTSPPHNSSSTACEECHRRPKYSDGTTTHPYCSKTCANVAKARNGASSSVKSSQTLPGNCDFCHNRPKYNDGTKTHSFCSKACAKASSGPGGGGNGAKGICQAPGCQKPAFSNSNGSLGDYCSLSHKTLGESVCLMCRRAPKMVMSHFCGQRCIDEAEKKGPMILEVPPGHVTFKSVTDQFKTSWRHVGTTCPQVKRVYKVLSPKASLASYNAYRAAVEARENFLASGRSEGNENRRWHGTRRQCHLGDKGQTQFCSSTTCSLCSIVRTSFDLSMWGKKTGWGRFGRGIYTSSTSSKANDYSHNDIKCSLKAVLLSKVVVGKGCKMTTDNVTLTAPPSGYDSVLAEKGGSLNYDELVVYTNDAIRPSFLVMYEA